MFKLKKILMGLMVMILSVSSFLVMNLKVHAEDDVKMAWVELSCEVPLDFHKDVYVMLSSDLGEGWDFTLYEVNDYKFNFQMREGTYYVEAAILNDNNEYEFVDLPETVTIKQTKAATPIQLTVQDKFFSNSVELDPSNPEDKEQIEINEKYEAEQKSKEKKGNLLVSITATIFGGLILFGGAYFVKIRYFD